MVWPIKPDGVVIGENVRSDAREGQSRPGILDMREKLPHLCSSLIEMPISITFAYSADCGPGSPVIEGREAGELNRASGGERGAAQSSSASGITAPGPGVWAGVRERAGRESAVWRGIQK